MHAIGKMDSYHEVLNRTKEAGAELTCSFTMIYTVTKKNQLKMAHVD
jgi:hypothetical protein